MQRSLWSLSVCLAALWPAGLTLPGLVEAAEKQGGMSPWAAAAFGDAAVPAQEAPGTLRLKRQDHGRLMLAKSALGTPIKIGGREFKHGLGTHANSEIAVALPPNAKAFQAMVGVDSGTAGERGSAQFSVEFGAREAFRSPVLRGGAEPAAVDLDIPEGTARIVLKTDMTADGPGWDHADWADARVLLKDGTAMWLDEMKLAVPTDFLPAVKVPFSFVCGGKASEQLLPTWKRTSEAKESGGRTSRLIQWADPQSGLRVAAVVTPLDGFPAVEWVLRFENAGKEDSPILENVQALDVVLGTPGAVVLDQIRGDDCSERSFMPVQQALTPGQNARFAPHGGRPSNGAFPFFNLQNEARHLFVAIGWTGQWAASVSRAADGSTQVKAGMELTRLKLHPGEAIRTPRILLMLHQGEAADAHNRFRQLLLTHYLPKVDGRVVFPAIGSQSFNMNYGGRRPQWNTEAGQVAAAKVTRQLGCDTHWLDAAWFDGGFPGGVGNWTVRKKEYPNGLKPVGDACAELGLKFLIWWEPERVAPGTKIAREHPEFVLGGDKGGLFNLGHPPARRWLTGLLLRQIDEFGVKTYRNDFNMDPLPYWRQNDPPDRQGITEIRYVEGFYEMWDEIRSKHPGMVMDDCASGGRRIDLEMCMRSIVQTRSDTACAPGRSDWDQAQTYGLSLFLPVHATIGWSTKPYDCRSSATAGFLGEWDILDPAFPLDEAKASIAEIRENQKYWYGDLHPLTAWSLASDQWMAYQFHRADLDDGMVLAFRRAESPYPGLQAKLRGLRPDRSYEVTLVDEERRTTTRVLSGAELGAIELRIANARSSLLVRYKPADGK